MKFGNQILLKVKYRLLFAFVFPSVCSGQIDNAFLKDTLVISERVGKVIDSTERARYKIFSNYSVNYFAHSNYVKYINKYSDTIIVQKVNFRDGSFFIDEVPLKEYKRVQRKIDKYGYRPKKPFNFNGEMWLTTGIGAASGGESFAQFPGLFAKGFSVSVLKSKHLFSFRMADGIRTNKRQISEQRNSNTSSSCSSYTVHSHIKEERVFDIGLLYGIGISGKNTFASISGGIAIVKGTNPGKVTVTSRTNIPCSYETFELFLGFIPTSGTATTTITRTTTEVINENYSTYGIPLEGQFFYDLNNYIALGVYGFGNINQKKSFGGALFCIRFGYLYH